MLVTGASGLVGSWLVHRLESLGAHVVCLVRDFVPQSEFVRSGLAGRVTVVRGDLLDTALLERILGEYEIDTVFHLAAQAIVTIANANPLSTFETNIRGTWLLLEACRRSPTVKQIVTASSDKAYGDQEHLPYNEDTPLQGRHPYDVSKSCADLLAQTYAATYGLPVVITRCGNFFGGGDLNWNRIVPDTIRSLLQKERPIIRSDGTYLRDYFYIEDGVEAYLLAAERLAEQPALRGEAFNFAYGKPLSVIAMVQKIAEVMGSSLQPVITNEATHEILDQYLDAAKAQRMLGWTPAWTLEDALKKTTDWYRRFFHDVSSPSA